MRAWWSSGEVESKKKTDSLMVSLRPSHGHDALSLSKVLYCKLLLPYPGVMDASLCKWDMPVWWWIAFFKKILPCLHLIIIPDFSSLIIIIYHQMPITGNILNNILTKFLEKQLQLGRGVTKCLPSSGGGGS